MNDAELRDLIERNYQITELQKTDGWLYLVDETRRLVEARRREILSGRLDHDKYIKTCGFVEGAEYVLAAGEHLAERVKRERENAKNGAS